jgi:hypothetical protein
MIVVDRGSVVDWVYSDAPDPPPSPNPPRKLLSHLSNVALCDWCGNWRYLRAAVKRVFLFRPGMSPSFPRA